MLRSGSSHPRLLVLRRAFVPVVLVVCAVLMVTGTVQAALPPKGATFSFHDHVTAGLNWHVEIRVDTRDKRKIKALVVYSQLCKATIAQKDVAISDAGVIAASGELKGGGTWTVNAQVVEPTKIVGTMQMTRADCDTGVLSYPNAVTGDGHTNHQHGAGGQQKHNHGPKFPDFDSASRTQRRQAQWLHFHVLRSWRGVTLDGAKRRGYVINKASTQRSLGMFHAYNKGYEKDGRIFDPKRPESLVFWRHQDLSTVLLGTMYRVSGRKRPKFAGPIPIYHSHGQTIKNQMTHVWLVTGSRTSWVNCLAVPQLQAYNPTFKWTPGGVDQGPNGEPC